MQRSLRAFFASPPTTGTATTNSTVTRANCGRDTGYPAPPAQIPDVHANASGSYLVRLTANR